MLIRAIFLSRKFSIYQKKIVLVKHKQCFLLVDLGLDKNINIEIPNFTKNQVERTYSNLSKLTLKNSNTSSSLNSKKFLPQNNWGFLRNRLVQAKMSDVFSNIRFTVNGSNIRALRCIGEGGINKYFFVKLQIFLSL